MTADDPISDPRDPELAFGLVAPVGTDTDGFADRLATMLGGFGYKSNRVRLSGFLKKVAGPDGKPIVIEAPEVERLRTYMNAGNLLRKATKRNDILALMSAAHVKGMRREPPVMSKTAHLLLTLKHPEEVAALRRIYGDGFFLIGVYESEERRTANLMRRHGMTAEAAADTVQRDAEEEIGHGQQARQAFELSDVFVPASAADADAGLHRFLDLVFGCPFVTPTPEEHAMFLAYAASVRSGSLSRQVGAVIVSRTGEVIAAGANDAPKPGGGPYWPGEDDQRDYVRGRDSNAAEIQEIVEESARRVFKALHDGAEPDTAGLQPIIASLRSSRFAQITEFGRDVHAEMDAMLTCARAGRSVRGATLYTTTFPCHNCAKHIVSAGIANVVFVEPYPKSKALALHDDALVLEGPAGDRRVKLRPFVGIGARRFLDLFSLRLGAGRPTPRRRDGIYRSEWKRAEAAPRVAMVPGSYLDREKASDWFVRRVLPGRMHANGGDA
ncbi:MAG TPA: anti-phage dCTP deaminase [Candidatus Polarisedimenticolaceae bacterium]